ncbi:MAG: hypothetical protein HYS81_00220 [Candidatus Aenigmatarchaeota archaeon]|nr:MAG: hypothetical protein HYS81_00220 [Candidatus Aenigmarchaeota archaeon]
MLLKNLNVPFILSLAMVIVTLAAGIYRLQGGSGVVSLYLGVVFLGFSVILAFLPRKKTT